MSKPRRPPCRLLDGIVLLDKPIGMSSNQALQRVRSLLRAEKAGHTGALDPLATGLLPLCFGEATKIASLLLSEVKAYRTRIRLGVVTDTDDAEGRILRQQPVPELGPDRIAAALATFTGRIRQVPPRYSALKQGGEPLYLRARRGETFDVPVREVEVRELRLLEQGRDWLELEIECGSGTYIRSLARDIGQALGCGAHVAALRRLWIDPFRKPQMVALQTLEALAEQGQAALDACLLPLEAGLIGYPTLTLDAVDAHRFGQGQILYRTGLGEGIRVVVDEAGRALGLVDPEADGRLRIRRLFRWAVV